MRFEERGISFEGGFFEGGAGEIEEGVEVLVLGGGLEVVDLEEGEEEVGGYEEDARFVVVFLVVGLEGGWGGGG